MYEVTVTEMIIFRCPSFKISELLRVV